jgi:hypothetical protein
MASFQKYMPNRDTPEGFFDGIDEHITSRGQTTVISASHQDYSSKQKPEMGIKESTSPFFQDSTEQSFGSKPEAPEPEDIFPPSPKSMLGLHPAVVYAIKWSIVTVLISVVIAIPMIALRSSLDDDETASIEEQLLQLLSNQWKNLGFWICAWVMVTWLSACLFHAASQIFPYLFRYVAKFVNPAHRRYWRVFRFMKWPITLLGCTIGSYISYYFVSYFHHCLAGCKI